MSCFVEIRKSAGLFYCVQGFRMLRCTSFDHRLMLNLLLYVGIDCIIYICINLLVCVNLIKCFVESLW